MDLALLVYGISVFSSLGTVSVVILAMSLLVLIITSISYLDETCRDKVFWYKGATRSLIVLISALIIVIVTPSEKTMYTMVGAYAAQKVAEDPKVQQLSGKVLKLVETKLDTYIEEAEKKVTK